MNEHVSLPITRSDKTKALYRIEPLDPASELNGVLPIILGDLIPFPHLPIQPPLLVAGL